MGSGIVAGLIFHGLLFSGRKIHPAGKQEIDLKSEPRDEARTITGLFLYGLVFLAGRFTRPKTRDRIEKRNPRRG